MRTLKYANCITWYLQLAGSLSYSTRQSDSTLFSTCAHLRLRPPVKVYVLLRAEQKRKAEEKLYNAWILVVPPLLRHVLLLAYFCIALELKICARL
jgi:hypothetical protein